MEAIKHLIIRNFSFNCKLAPHDYNEAIGNTVIWIKMDEPEQKAVENIVVQWNITNSCSEEIIIVKNIIVLL